MSTKYDVQLLTLKQELQEQNRSLQTELRIQVSKAVEKLEFRLSADIGKVNEKSTRQSESILDLYRSINRLSFWNLDLQQLLVSAEVEELLAKGDGAGAVRLLIPMFELSILQQPEFARDAMLIVRTKNALGMLGSNKGLMTAELKRLPGYLTNPDAAIRWEVHRDRVQELLNLLD